MDEEPGHNYVALYHSNAVALADGRRPGSLVCARQVRLGKADALVTAAIPTRGLLCYGHCAPTPYCSFSILDCQTRGHRAPTPPHVAPGALLAPSATMATCSPAHATGDKGEAAVEDHPHWRRHQGACPFYRENWIVSDADDAAP